MSWNQSVMLIRERKKTELFFIFTAHALAAFLLDSKGSQALKMHFCEIH